MPTTGAPTSGVVYLCPLETYRQWIPPTTPATGPLAWASVGEGNGQYPVTVWPQLTYPTGSSYVGDRPQVIGVPAAPCSYQYQQPDVSASYSTAVNVSNISNQCHTSQTSHTVIIPSPTPGRHDNVIQPLNPTDLVIDQSANNPLVLSNK